jgi:DNA invertase Pin-like site-specific DNA recombinase
MAGPQVPVAIYTRVSTDNQTGGRFDSCESQAAICRESIRKRLVEGWYEVACYTDAAYSGGTMDRPGIRALKRQIEAGEVKVVLIYKMERVLRSTDEWVPFRSFLQKYGCRLESATEDISENTPSGRLKNNLLMSVAEYERLNTAEKTRAKMLQQAKQGIWNGGWLPYGLAYDSKTQMLSPHPVEAPIVRRIYEQAANFVPLQEIANALNAEGLRTRERELLRRDGKIETIGGQLFRSDGLRITLKNPIYRGAIRFAGEEYSGRHEPIVSAETWETANAVAAETKEEPKPRTVDRESQTHLLKGIVYCGACGRALVPHESGKKNAEGKPYRYYNCGYVLKEREPGKCPVGRLPAAGLETVVKEFVTRLSQHPDVVSAVIASARERRQVDRPSLHKESEAIQRELERVKKRLKNCIDIAVAGGVEVVSDSFKERVGELEKQRQHVTVNLERKRHEIVACDAAIMDQKQVVRALAQLGDLLPKIPFQEQKKLFRLFVDRIEVRKVGGRAGEGRRLLELRMKMFLPRLVEGLAAQLSTGAVRQRPTFPITVRGVTFAAVVDFSGAVRGEVCITSPFAHVVRMAGRSSRLRPEVPNQVVKVHPMVRALEWEAELARGAVANRAALAAKLGVSRAAVTQYLKLTQLAPEIIAWLKTVDRPEQWKETSLRRLMWLASLDLQKQRQVFSGLKSGI